MKRYDPKVTAQFSPMDEAIQGRFVSFEDVQQLAKEVLPYVVHTANVLRNCGVTISYAPTAEVFNLVARLQSIIGEQP